ncbi:MAG: AMP-binding protein [Chloroflexota bacterium]
MTKDTILHRLHRNAKSFGDKAAYYEKENGSWKPTNWSDYTAETRQAARALISLGLQERDIVTILGFNRSEWSVMALASMLMGGTAAGIYTSNAPSEVQYIVDHAKSKLILIEDMKQWEKIKAERENMPSLQHVIMMRGDETPDDPMVWSWKDFLSQGDEVPDSVIDERLDALQPNDLATMIYTSGTTGPPKGVMLSHENIQWTSEIGKSLLGWDNNEVLLSYLPLSHIAEQMFSIHTAITSGYTIYYAEDPLKVADNIKEVQPTVLFGVPRVWERFYNGISAQLDQATGIRASIGSWARGVGTQVTELRNQGKEPSGLLAMQYNLASRLVFSKIREALGLTRTTHMISGAAPIPKQILDFFASLDMPIYEVYGQSEDTGPTSFNIPGDSLLGSVGKPIPGMDVKITEEGEIIAKGPNVFLGYYNNPKATESTLIDGWLYSGDLGKIDDDGFLHITGRKKDIIITSGGKNIAPKNLEAAMTSLELVSSAVCIGEQQRYLIGLVTLEPEAAKRFADEHGLDVNNLHNEQKLKDRLMEDIKAEVNSHFARVEHIRNIVVLPNDFSVESGELTPTFKIKRAVVNKMYEPQIVACYEEGQKM